MSCLERDSLTQQLIETVKSYSDAVDHESVEQACAAFEAALTSLRGHEREHGCARVKPGDGPGDYGASTSWQRPVQRRSTYAATEPERRAAVQRRGCQMRPPS